MEQHDNSNSNSPTTFEALPQELVIQLLAKVPAGTRLKRCALVSTAWSRAAAAATDDVELANLPTPSHMKAAQDYLQLNSQHVTRLSMQLSLFDMDLAMLPCTQLRELVLSGGSLEPSALHAIAPTLTKLVLEGNVYLSAPGTDPEASTSWTWSSCCINDAWGSAPDEDTDSDEDAADVDASRPPAAINEALSSMRSLKHLQCSYLHDHPSARFGAALPHLTALTYLQVSWWSCHNKAWRQHLRGLTDLRVLIICDDKDWPRDADFTETVPETVLDGVQHLQRLTELQVRDVCIRVTLDSRSTLGALTALKTLHLEHCHLDLAVLAAVTGIQELHLGAGYPDDEDWVYDVERWNSWLVVNGKVDRPAEVRALSAMSNLRQLCLSGASDKTFISGLQPLPQLTLLHLVSGGLDVDEARLLAGMTLLQDLKAPRLVGPSKSARMFQMLELAALPQLTKLQYACDDDSDDEGEAESGNTLRSLGEAGDEDDERVIMRQVGRFLQDRCLRIADTGRNQHNRCQQRI